MPQLDKVASPWRRLGSGAKHWAPVKNNGFTIFAYKGFAKLYLHNYIDLEDGHTLHLVARPDEAQTQSGTVSGDQSHSGNQGSSRLFLPIVTFRYSLLQSIAKPLLSICWCLI